MKPADPILISLAIVLFLSTVRASEDPTGTWKWNTMRSGKTTESTARLKFEADKLTGVYVRSDGAETAITNASFKDSAVKFDVLLDVAGNQFTLKYSGTLSGDTIKGKIEFHRDGQIQSRDWEAKRQK